MLSNSSKVSCESCLIFAPRHSYLDNITQLLGSKKIYQFQILSLCVKIHHTLNALTILEVYDVFLTWKVLGINPNIWAEKANFFIWTVHLDFTSLPPCIWLVRTANSLRLAETNSTDQLSTRPFSPQSDGRTEFLLD